MHRYSEIPKDKTSNLLSAPKENSNHSSRKLSLNYDQSRKISTVSTPHTSLSPYDCGEKRLSVPAYSKSYSLPNHGSSNYIKNYTCAVFNITDVPPEDFATQLTLIDLPLFVAIEPDELTSCAWNKKNKLEISPNVTAFTRQFNHVNFWTVQQILNGLSPKRRSEIITHFIKIAKKLYELNNLHSLFAIISSLQSVSIYRLTKSWNLIPKKDKQAFDKLANVFSNKNNWEILREHMESLRLPCIPYLGIYLTDLTYIDMAHPHSGGLESNQRLLKMNNILRIISNYQQSDFSHLSVVPHVRDYLKSIRYIEELQKFVEDDHYKLSLQLEPTSPIPSSPNCSSEESVIVNPATIASLNLSPAKFSTGSLRLHAATVNAKTNYGHRKTKSLGTNIFGKTNRIDNDNLAKTLFLLDDSEYEESKKSATVPPDELHSPKSELLLRTFQKSTDNCTLLAKFPEDSINSEENIIMEGYVRKKTIMKENKRPMMSSWQRYWIQIWPSSLVYFSSKSFKGYQRSDFKKEPYKVCSIFGCEIMLDKDCPQKDTIFIFDHNKGNGYKFRLKTPNLAERWCNSLQKIAKGGDAPLPNNLMSFD